MTESIVKNPQSFASANLETESSERTPGRVAATGNRRYTNGVFFVLAACLVAALGFFKRSPQSVAAAPASAAFDDYLCTELPTIKNVDRALNGADKAADEFKFLPSKVQVPLTELKANPFRHKGAEISPIDSQDDPVAQQQREKERVATLQAVQTLRLQSIAHGASQRTCTINSTRYQEGQEAGGFLIEEIASNTVVVRKGVYRFELKPSL